MEHRMLDAQSHEIESAEGLQIDINTYRSNSIKSKSSINSYKAIESNRSKSQRGIRRESNRTSKEQQNYMALLGIPNSVGSQSSQRSQQKGPQKERDLVTIEQPLE